MRKLLHASLIIATIGALLTITGPGRALAQNVACYFDPGGAGFHLGSGCTLTVESSGSLNVASGGTFKIGGTTVSATAAQLNELTTAGTIILDGSNPTSVTTGLTTIHGCTVTIQGSDAPGADPTAFSVVTDASAGRLDIYAWKPTASGDTALIASTNSSRYVEYHCAGN